MNKLLLVAVVAATSTVASAFDYKINLEGRMDFLNSNVKTTPRTGTAVSDKYNTFANGFIRLNMLGSINENLTYRFRYRFLASNGTPSTATRESNSTGVDYFFVDHKNSTFTSRFGKQNWVEAFGREAYVSGTDVFLTSAAASNFKSAIGDYRIGATAMFKFMDTNNFSIAVSNPNPTFSDASTATDRKNNGMAYAAHYNGNFADKLIQPVLAYTLAEQNGDTDAATPATKTKKANYTMMNAGLRSEFLGLVLDADYKQFKKADRNDGTNVTAANKMQKTKSIWANAAYAVGDFTPMVTYINDKYTTDDTITATNANFKRNSFAVGTYYKPYNDVNFRYHLMFTNAVTKYEGTISTNTKITDRKIYLGFKADI